MKLCDFGLIFQLNSQNDIITEMKGTQKYFSPERHETRYGLKSDIWSFGITLYEIAQGNIHRESKIKKKKKCQDSRQKCREFKKVRQYLRLSTDIPFQFGIIFFRQQVYSKLAKKVPHFEFSSVEKNVFHENNFFGFFQKTVFVFEIYFD